MLISLHKQIESMNCKNCGGIESRQHQNAGWRAHRMSFAARRINLLKNRNGKERLNDERLSYETKNTVSRLLLAFSLTISFQDYYFSLDRDRQRLLELRWDDGPGLSPYVHDTTQRAYH